MTEADSEGPPPADAGPQPSAAARVGTWLAWWVVLTSFWIMIDDSLATDELLAGAGAGALGALAAELATYHAGVRPRLRLRWLGPALRLPGQVVSDTVVVYRALWRRIVTGEQPDSAFVTEAARHGGDSPGEMARRVLLVGGRSLAPNTFALGIDAETDTMVLHELVRKRGK
jgi:multisubunit Na+/H+ antiporter MnhE subunit